MCVYAWKIKVSKSLCICKLLSIFIYFYFVSWAEIVGWRLIKFYLFISNIYVILSELSFTIFGCPTLVEQHPMKFVCLSVHLEIEYNDSLQQWLTSSRGKTHKKFLGDQIWAKIGSRIRFFVIFSRVVH